MTSSLDSVHGSGTDSLESTSSEKSTDSETSSVKSLDTLPTSLTPFTSSSTGPELARRTPPEQLDPATRLGQSHDPISDSLIIYSSSSSNYK